MLSIYLYYGIVGLWALTAVVFVWRFVDFLRSRKLRLLDKLQTHSVTLLTISSTLVFLHFQDYLDLVAMNVIDRSISGLEVNFLHNYDLMIFEGTLIGTSVIAAFVSVFVRRKVQQTTAAP